MDNVVASTEYLKSQNDSYLATHTSYTYNFNGKIYLSLCLYVRWGWEGKAHTEMTQYGGKVQVITFFLFVFILSLLMFIL